MKAIGVVGVVSRGSLLAWQRTTANKTNMWECQSTNRLVRVGLFKGMQKNVKIGYAMSLSKSKILKLEHEITRITDRIADIEFEVTHINPTELLKKGDLMVERRRAIDKLRHLKDDLYRLKVDNINET